MDLKAVRSLSVILSIPISHCIEFEEEIVQAFTSISNGWPILMTEVGVGLIANQCPIGSGLERNPRMFPRGPHWFGGSFAASFSGHWPIGQLCSMTKHH